MTTFTVWKFDDPEGAKRAAGLLKKAQEDQLVRVLDHAVISWPAGKSKPDLDHTDDSVHRGAAWGVLWGVVGGLLFTIPILGGVLGAGVGALAKMTKDAGITKDDLRVIRTEVVEGTSALCVVTEDANLDRLAERMRGVDKTLVSTNLTGAEHETLLETFGGQ
jgi:uncharacterized membrane protein